MFALTGLSSWGKGEQKINLKCDPDWAEELRDEYEGINHGWHMHKKHWNTVSVRGSLEDPLIYSWIDHSYQKVIEGMSQKRRQELGF